MVTINKKLLINGLGMNVVIAGADNPGTPVLLVHGFPDTHAVWRKQIPVLEAAGYKIIAPDTRGCGESDIPQRTADYHLDHLISDLVTLLDKLGIDKVKLVAHDWGAVQGWYFALRHPERVERYVALSVGHPNAYGTGGIAQKLKGWYVLMFQLRGFAEWLLKARNWAFFRWFTRFPAEYSHWREVLGRQGRLTAGINYYRANLSLIVTRGLPNAKVPVHGIYSTGDRFLTEGQMRNTEQFVDAPFTYDCVAGANHWLTLDAPDQVNALLLKRLA